MRVDIDTNEGQLNQGGDIHNVLSVIGNHNIGNIMAGGSVSIAFHGDIHIHLTLSGAEQLSVLVDLLKKAKIR